MAKNVIFKIYAGMNQVRGCSTLTLRFFTYKQSLRIHLDTQQCYIQKCALHGYLCSVVNDDLFIFNGYKFINGLKYGLEYSCVTIYQSLVVSILGHAHLIGNDPRMIG